VVRKKHASARLTPAFTAGVVIAVVIPAPARLAATPMVAVFF